MMINPNEDMIVARYIVPIDVGTYLVARRERLRREHRFTWGWRWMREVRRLASR